MYEDIFLPVNRAIVNRDDNRYIRILWANTNPDWDLIPLDKILSRRYETEIDPEPVLLLDHSVICLC